MAMEHDDAIEQTYRKFACWAARRAWELAGCKPCENVVLAVEAYLRNEIDLASMRAARDAAAGGVAGAGVVGIPRGMPSAAAQVAAWHTADDSAKGASSQVIHHTAVCAAFAALGKAAEEADLDPIERKSSWRNLHVFRRRPDIEAGARWREQSFLEGELQRWLKDAKAGDSSGET
jgi:hypothetical protein